MHFEFLRYKYQITTVIGLSHVTNFETFNNLPFSFLSQGNFQKLGTSTV